MNSPHIVRKATSPSSAPPEEGIHWINTVTHEEFFSVGTTSVNQWIKRAVTRTADALETTVWNQTGVTIPQFSVVYINGSQGTYPTVALAQANSEMTSTGTYGVTANAIPNNQQGTVIPFGLLENINTNGFTDGQPLWLSPTVAGAVTGTKPSAPNHIVFIGTVTRAHPSLGRVEIKVVNGYELDELHNVAISTPSNGQTLTYNSSTQLWTNHTLTKSDVGLSNVDNTSDANKPISTATQTALNLKQATITGAATSIVSSDLTASKILVSNGSGKVSASSIDSANLNYLDATSSIQTQLNFKAADADVLKKDGSVSLTGDLNLGTHKITNVVDPSSNQDAATKFYVDNLVSGLDWKQACHVASIANVNIASAPASIDGHAFVNTERVLLKDQSTASENGIYVFNGTGNALTRATDADTWNEIVGSVVYIEQGSTNGGSKWNCTNVSGGTLGVTAINFTLFSSASSLSGVGTTNYNAYWTGANVLSAEQYVSISRGGLGTDGSSFTGVVKSSSGSFSASSIDNADISVSAAIDATKIGSGSVSNTEFGYLDGVSSSVQTQINDKVSKAGDTMTGPLIVSGSASAGNAMMRVTNTGVGDTLIVEDATNPDASNFKIDSNGFIFTGSLLSTVGTSGRMQILDSQNAFVECKSGSTRAVSFGASNLGNGFRSSLGPLDISTTDSGDAITISPVLGDNFGPSYYTISNGTNNVTGINNITPTEALDVTGNVKASGTVTGSNLSGTNTGDETTATIKTKLGSASNIQDGYLTSTDWTTFNNKADLEFIPKLSGIETYRGVLYQNNSTTVSTENSAGLGVNGTPTARAVANTNQLTKQVRMAYAVSTPAASAVCGVRSLNLLWSIGSGFRMAFSFAYTDSALNTGARQFYGMHSLSGGITISSTVTVDSLTNMFCIGSDAADTSLCIFYNDASGVASKIVLGAAHFPANRGASPTTDIFSVEFYNEVGTSTVKYRVTNLTTMVKAHGTLSTDLPASSTLLTFQAIRTSGASSNACSMDLTKFGVWSIN